LIKALQQDPYIYNVAWAEFVALQMIIEGEQTNRLQKELALELLLSLSKNAQQKGLREAATFFWLEKSKLSTGQKWSKNYIENDLGLRLVPHQYIYLHHYIPGNQKCIAEMAALKRLAERYKNKVQIITFVQADAVWTNADKKAFEGANWQRLDLPKTATLWQQLGWKSAPAYILLDPELKVLYLDALGPLPNARTQTIDVIFGQLFQN
jgi:hypothetical protein